MAFPTHKRFPTRTAIAPTNNALQLPPSLTQHLPDKSSPPLYHNAVLRRHESLFAVGQRDGHHTFLPMPSSHRLFRGNWTLGGQRNTSNISTHQCDDDRVVWKGENNSFHGNYTPICTNSWWAFHVHHASYVGLMPILYISFAIRRFKLAEDQELLLTRWVSLRNEDSASILASSLLVDCSPVLTLFGFAWTSSAWYAPICHGPSSLFNKQQPLLISYSS